MVAIHVFGDLGELLAGVFGQYFCDAVFEEDAFFEHDFLVGDFAFGAGGGLVDHDAGVGEGKAFAFGAGAEEESAHGGLEADADGLDVWLDVLDGIVDGEAVVNAAAGGVDVEFDVFFGILVGEVEELGDDDGGGVGVDVFAEEDYAFVEQAGVDVEGALAAVGFFYYCGD